MKLLKQFTIYRKKTKYLQMEEVEEIKTIHLVFKNIIHFLLNSFILYHTNSDFVDLLLNKYTIIL